MELKGEVVVLLFSFFCPLGGIAQFRGPPPTPPRPKCSVLRTIWLTTGLEGFREISTKSQNANFRRFAKKE